MIDLREALKKRILPAVTFDDASQALKVAEIFLTKGLAVMEVPLRTPVALEAISLVRKHFPEMTIGVGTILNTSQLQQAIDAGAEFGLSAGLNPGVLATSIAKDFAFIPGVMTPGEIEKCLEMGVHILKLFPAAQVGGVDFLKAVNGPYGHLGVKFIPMGGVNAQNTPEYLALPNVIAIGGSWIAAKNLLSAKNYSGIEANVTALLNE